MEQQPQQPHTTTNQTNIIVVNKSKSTGTAFILAFLFGPLGLLYASVPGGIIMMILGLISFFIAPLIGFIIIWILCIIWAVAATGSSTQKVHSKEVK